MPRLFAFDWIAYVVFPALLVFGAPLALCRWADDMPRNDSEDEAASDEERPEADILPLAA